MIQELKDLFQTQPISERYTTSKDLFVCKMTEDSSVSETCTHTLWVHILRIKMLGILIPNELVTDIILVSLPQSYSSLLMNHP